MPVSKDTLRQWVQEQLNTELRETSVERVTAAARVSSASVAVIAGESLFDTEPSHLELALNDVAQGASS